MHIEFKSNFCIVLAFTISYSNLINPLSDLTALKDVERWW